MEVFFNRLKVNRNEIYISSFLNPIHIHVYIHTHEKKSAMHRVTLLFESTHVLDYKSLEDTTFGSTLVVDYKS